MTRRKYSVVRPYPPTFVSRSTLAYQLDLSDTSVATLIAKGALPKAKPGLDGIERWWWPEVEAIVRGLKSEADLDGQTDVVDPYMQGVLNRAKTS
jgi:hypothetical protein